MKKILKAAGFFIAFVAVFFVGYGLGARKTDSTSKDYTIYDSPEKIDLFYKAATEAVMRSLPGRASDDPLVKQKIESVYEIPPPLVTIGSLTFCFNRENGDYAVYKTNQSEGNRSIVEVKTSADSKTISFGGDLEKDWKYPRFRFDLFYSNDNVYQKGRLYSYRKDGSFLRGYIDTDGDGKLNRMDTFENNIHAIYSLEGLAFEKVVEKPFGESMKEYERLLHSPSDKALQ